MAFSVRRTDPTCALASFQAGAPQLVDLRPGGALRALPALGPGVPSLKTLRTSTLQPWRTVLNRQAQGSAHTQHRNDMHLSCLSCIGAGGLG